MDPVSIRFVCSSTQSLCNIFDECDSPIFAEPGNGWSSAGIPEQGDGHDGSGAWGDGGAELFGATDKIIHWRVHQHGRKACAHDSLKASDERACGKQDFITALQSQQMEGEYEGIRSGIHCNCLVPAGKALRQSSFELLQLRAQYVLATLQHVRKTESHALCELWCLPRAAEERHSHSQDSMAMARRAAAAPSAALAMAGCVRAP